MSALHIYERFTFEYAALQVQKIDPFAVRHSPYLNVLQPEYAILDIRKSTSMRDSTANI